MNEQAEERTLNAHQKRTQAKEVINRWAGESPKEKFGIGDRVWLEGKNLKLPYQNLKLAPKRYGPFKVRRVISPVAYQLDLPPSWMIHDVFHAGLLSPYHETEQYGANFPRPPQTSSTEKRNMRSRPSEIINDVGQGELYNT